MPVRFPGVAPPSFPLPPTPLWPVSGGFSGSEVSLLSSLLHENEPPSIETAWGVPSTNMDVVGEKWQESCDPVPALAAVVPGGACDAGCGRPPALAAVVPGGG